MSVFYFEQLTAFYTYMPTMHMHVSLMAAYRSTYLAHLPHASSDTEIAFATLYVLCVLLSWEKAVNESYILVQLTDSVLFLV